MAIFFQTGLGAGEGAGAGAEAAASKSHSLTTRWIGLPPKKVLVHLPAPDIVFVIQVDPAP